MTTKPKAKKYRIRRSSGASDAARAAKQPAADAIGDDVPPANQADASAKGLSGTIRNKVDTLVQPPSDDSPASQPGSNAPAQNTQPANGGVRAETDIEAIRKEGLTGRQLRMARRMAQKHGLAPISDFDAVRQLRSLGIDPFQRANMIELVVPKGGGAGGHDGGGGIPVDTGGEPPDMGGNQLPQTVPAGNANLPSTDTMSPAQRREKEIMEIQRDIARRRRTRLALLFARLAAFVFLPTALAGWYYFTLATPMYSTKTEFMILQADGGGGAIGGGLLPSNYATSQDSIAVQSYMLSKDAMIRLDAEHGFKSHFSDPSIDAIQRLAADASNEKAHKLYKKMIVIGYDPTEGVVRMEVIAADPKVAYNFSQLLVEFAEERVDELSREKREDAMASANKSLEDARQERRKAQEALVNLQETQGADPTEQLAVLRSQISNYEAELLEKELQLAALLDNPRPNRAKVDGARADVTRLKALLETLNARMIEGNGSSDSLAARSARMQLAQADLSTADLFLQNALQTAKQAELEASKQVRYLTVPVMPIQAQEPSYPRAFENTILAFLIFSGIYLMISLTASILREQVSS